jgi:hypothetical protein
MNTQVTTRITIDASPAAVFEYLITLRLLYLWSPHLESVSPKSLERLSDSVVYKTTTLLFGIKVHAENKVIKFVQDKQMTAVNETGLLNYRLDYNLRQLKSGSTVLTCSTEISADSKAFAFAKPVFKTLTLRELQSDLDSLKFAVEQQLQNDY